MAITVCSSRIRGQEPNEYQVKAVFLLNFARFVEWPKESFKDPQDLITICVTGEDPFGSYLDDAVRGQTAMGRPIRVQRFRQWRTMRGCQVIFISSSDKKEMPTMFNTIWGALTVGDTHDFARQGGMIGFVLEDQHVRFEINPDAAKRAGVKVSSKLLSLARIVETHSP